MAMEIHHKLPTDRSLSLIRDRFPYDGSYIHIYICICIYIYVYIYVYVCVCVCLNNPEQQGSIT